MAVVVVVVVVPAPRPLPLPTVLGASTTAAVEARATRGTCRALATSRRWKRRRRAGGGAGADDDRGGEDGSFAVDRIRLLGSVSVEHKGPGDGGDGRSRL